MFGAWSLGVVIVSRSIMNISIHPGPKTIHLILLPVARPNCRERKTAAAWLLSPCAPAMDEAFDYTASKELSYSVSAPMKYLIFLSTNLKYPQRMQKGGAAHPSLSYPYLVIGMFWFRAVYGMLAVCTPKTTLNN